MFGRWRKPKLLSIDRRPKLDDVYVTATMQCPCGNSFNFGFKLREQAGVHARFKEDDLIKTYVKRAAPATCTECLIRR